MPAIGEIRKARDLGYKAYYKYIWHCCPNCGKQYWLALCNASRRSGLCRSCAHKGTLNPNYGKGLRGSQNPRWRGGKKYRQDGYVMVWLDPDDFFYPMHSTNNYIMEHRLVMAKHLKRCLLPWEVVHHRNGIKDDNRIENLQLLPSRPYHISDSQLKLYVGRLQRRVKELELRLASQ